MKHSTLGRLGRHAGLLAVFAFLLPIFQTNAAPLPSAASERAERADVRVTGRVTDAAGEPLIGATVSVKGAAIGTTTDFDGRYTLTVPDGATLVFSYTGFATQEIAVAGRSVIDVVLSESIQTLEQVVVVGYGTLTRKQTTGAISQVRGDQLAKQPVLTPIQAIQGLAPGIRVVGSGQPGAQPRVSIRGLNTILSDENPLYVVDGVLTTDITNINMADVVAVDVLKDGAAAIYGTRGANGVVLITTRKGKTGKISITLDAYRGFRQLTNKVKMANAEFYAVYTNEARRYDNQGPLLDPLKLKADTDWFDEIIRNGTVQNYSVTASGGTENADYLFSAGWFNDEGVLLGADFDRFTFRTNNEFRPYKRLKFGNNLSVALPRSTNKSAGVFTDAYRMSPATPVKDSTGNWGAQAGLSVGNPVAALELQNDFSKSLRLQGNLYSQVELLDGLNFRTSWGFDRGGGNNTSFRPLYNYGIFTSSVTELRVRDDLSNYWVWDNILSYSKAIGEHQLELMAGHSAERDRFRASAFRVADVPEDRNLWYLNQGDPETLSLTESSGVLYRRESYFGRANFSIQNKYHLSATLRRDGSSVFPPARKWGSFYSIGAAWVLTEESFLKDNDVLDYLKLRGNYAVLGNDNIAKRYGNGLSQLSPISNTDPYGLPGGLVQGITIDEIPDSAATWETTKGFDIGLEFGFATRLVGEISYYNKLTGAYVVVRTPAFVDKNGILTPAADVRNQGLELGLKWSDKISSSFSYNVNANLTRNINDVEKIRGGIDLKEGGLGNGHVTTSTIEGEPIGSFWVFETDGIYQTKAEIDADGAAAFTGTLPGDFRYVDQNDDGVLDDRDRIYAGSYQPKFFYGIGGGVNWKQFDFAIDCYGNAGNKIYNGKKGVRFGNENIEDARRDRWAEFQPNTTTEPRASNTIPKPSTYFLESGDFFRINNVTLGYTLPKMRGLSRARLFLTAQNPLIAKKFSGFSPELPGSNALNSGIELYIYPTLTTYMAGFSVGF